MRCTELAIRRQRTSPPHTGQTEQPVSEQYSVSPNCITPVPWQYLHSTVPMLLHVLQDFGGPSCMHHNLLGSNQED